MNADSVTVAATAGGTLIVSKGGTAGVPRAVLIQNPTGGQTVYLGANGVDTTEGFPLVPGATIGWDLVDESVYGIVATGTQAVKVLAR